MIIQRHSMGIWPQIRGLRPFLVRGPNHQARIGLSSTIKETTVGMERIDALQIIGELVLIEGIVSALWMTSSHECVSLERRWDSTIDQFVREVPDLVANPYLVESLGLESQLKRGFTETTQLELEVEELLSGMEGKEFRVNRFSSDDCMLEELAIPTHMRDIA